VAVRRGGTREQGVVQPATSDPGPGGRTQVAPGAIDRSHPARTAAGCPAGGHRVVGRSRHGLAGGRSGEGAGQTRRPGGNRVTHPGTAASHRRSAGPRVRLRHDRRAAMEHLRVSGERPRTGCRRGRPVARRSREVGTQETLTIPCCPGPDRMTGPRVDRRRPQPASRSPVPVHGAGHPPTRDRCETCPIVAPPRPRRRADESQSHAAARHRDRLPGPPDGTDLGRRAPADARDHSAGPNPLPDLAAARIRAIRRIRRHRRASGAAWDCRGAGGQPRAVSS
jgi:hypothetical protein